MNAKGPRTSRLGRAARALAFVGLSGCATGPTGISPFTSVAAYQRSNAFSPTGFSESIIDETHFQVTAGGTETTSSERVEKIALARAAEIGVERRFGYFKVLSVTHGATCSKKRELSRGTVVPATRAPTVVLDVIYAKRPPPGDDGFKASKETFSGVSADLAGEVQTPESAAAALAALQAKCGA